MKPKSAPDAQRKFAAGYRVSPAELAAIERRSEEVGLQVSAMLRSEALKPEAPVGVVEIPKQPRTLKQIVWTTAAERRRMTQNAKAAGYASRSDWIRDKGLQAV